MGSLPAVGPGAGTAGVMGAKILKTTVGGVFGLVRKAGGGFGLFASLIAGALLLGYGRRLLESDPLHPDEQPA